MTTQEYNELQNWLSDWKSNKRKQNKMFAINSKDSAMIDSVIKSVKSYVSGMQEEAHRLSDTK